jgi:hypothetical protein
MADNKTHIGHPVLKSLCSSRS